MSNENIGQKIIKSLWKRLHIQPILFNLLLIIIIFILAELYLCTKEYLRVEKERNNVSIQKGLEPEHFNIKQYYYHLKNAYRLILKDNEEISVKNFRKQSIKGGGKIL